MIDALNKQLLRQLPRTFSLPDEIFLPEHYLQKKKCDGSEKLCAGDCIELFLAEDTIEKFRGNTDEKKVSSIQTQTQNVSLSPKSIIYEDDDILLINKAAGELSQKASPKDVSMVEKVIGYALSTQKVTNEQLLVCRPSVCNRLDRNTSGLIAAGFSIRGLQFLYRYPLSFC